MRGRYLIFEPPNYFKQDVQNTTLIKGKLELGAVVEISGEKWLVKKFGRLTEKATCFYREVSPVHFNLSKPEKINTPPVGKEAWELLRISNNLSQLVVVPHNGENYYFYNNAEGRFEAIEAQLKPNTNMSKLNIPEPKQYTLTYKKNGQNQNYRVVIIEKCPTSFNAYAFGRGVRTFLNENIVAMNEIGASVLS